jgi:hypothetical protein
MCSLFSLSLSYFLTPAQCSPTSDRQCSGCDVCEAGVKYQAQACTAEANTVCAACTNCDLRVEFQVSAKTGRQRCAVCFLRRPSRLPHTRLLPRLPCFVACEPSRKSHGAQTLPCSPFSNRQCQNLTQCDPWQFELAAPLLRQDRVCRNISSCQVCNTHSHTDIYICIYSCIFC